MRLDHVAELVWNTEEQPGKLIGDHRVQADEKDHQQEGKPPTAPGQLHHQKPHDNAYVEVAPARLDHFP